MFDLSKLDSVKIGVIGDFALDIYWHANMKKSELSRETPHFPLPVERERISLGAAGNAAANIAALCPGKLYVCGVMGDDWRGMLMREQLAALGADTSGMIIEEGRFTNAYCKPMRRNGDVEYEDPRIDFAASAPVSQNTETAVLAWLEKTAPELDILCVCDQFANGIVTSAVREKVSSLEIPVIADSRDHIGEFHDIILKPNEEECRAALLSLGEEAGNDDEANARLLARLCHSRVMLTLGERGSLWFDGEARRMKSVKYDGPVDFCGAGDTFLSAFAVFTAAGAAYTGKAASPPATSTPAATVSPR